MVDVKKMRADIELLRTSEPMSESFHDAQVRLLRSLADLLELLDAWGHGTLGGPEKTQVETPLERAKREGRERDVLKAVLDSGWLTILARDLQARWQAGFELACEEERRQRRAYEQTAEGKVAVAAAAAQADEERRTREEALRVVALSGVREKYPWTNEMDEISGMGAVCENACRDMLYSGLAWLDGHAGADLKATAYRNIIGALNADSDDAKLLEKAVLAVCPGALGSMHEAVLSACIFIALRGWAAYVEAMTKAK